MKYQKEFETELKIFLNDYHASTNYTCQEIHANLYEYWSSKDELDAMFTEEKELNKFLIEFRLLSKYQQKAYAEFSIKKLKYQTNGKD